MPPHRDRARLRGLYVITDERWGGGHIAIARAALAGGAAIVQLRDKVTPRHQLLAVARAMAALCRAAGALLIINDDVELAAAAPAHGVHLGPGDTPAPQARALLGPAMLIGLSCGTAAEAAAAQSLGADYVGAGAVYATTTKNDAGRPIGMGGLRAICAATELPVAAIGGLGATTVGRVLRAGAAMACVVSAVAGAGDGPAMTAATRHLATLCTGAALTEA